MEAHRRHVEAAKARPAAAQPNRHPAGGSSPQQVALDIRIEQTRSGPQFFLKVKREGTPAAEYPFQPVLVQPGPPVAGIPLTFAGRQMVIPQPMLEAILRHHAEQFGGSVAPEPGPAAPPKPAPPEVGGPPVLGERSTTALSVSWRASSVDSVTGYQLEVLRGGEEPSKARGGAGGKKKKGKKKGDAAAAEDEGWRRCYEGVACYASVSVRVVPALPRRCRPGYAPSNTVRIVRLTPSFPRRTMSFRRTYPRARACTSAAAPSLTMCTARGQRLSGALAVPRAARALPAPTVSSGARLARFVDLAPLAVATPRRAAADPLCRMETAAEAPGAPEAPTLTGKKPHSLTLKWAAPLHTGGRPPIGYTLVWDEGDAARSTDSFAVVYTGPERRFKVRRCRRRRCRVHMSFAAGSAAGHLRPWHRDVPLTPPPPSHCVAPGGRPERKYSVPLRRGCAERDGRERLR